MVPVSTRLPDEAGLPSAFCCVTVSVGKPVGGTPDQSVTDSWLMPSPTQDLVRSIYAADVVGPTISLCEPKPFARHSSA
jgi:hypothetical protein